MIETTTERTQASAHGAWLLRALLLAVLLTGALAACTETGVDPYSGSTIVRRRDTVIVEITRRDTVVQREVEVITDTLIREITINDTLVRIDTVVRYDTVARILLRQATVYKQNRSGAPDSSVIDIADRTSLDITGASPNHRIALETLIPLARALPTDRFGQHGWSILYIYIPEQELKLGSIQLRRDPDVEAGAALTIRDRQIETGDPAGILKSWGDFRIDDVDVRRRLIMAEFRGTFYYPEASGWTAEHVRVAFRFGY